MVNKKHFRPLILCFSLISFILGGILYKYIDLSVIFASFKACINTLGKLNPIVYMISISVLPAFGVPVSLFYIVSGLAYDLNTALVVSSIGIMNNLLLTYWLTKSFLHKPIQGFLLKKGFPRVKVPAEEVLKITLLIRILPGLPFFLQSYLLGIISIPFLPYFIISILTQFMWAVLYIIFGNALHESSWGFVISAILAIVVFGLIINILSKYKLNLKEKWHEYRSS